MFLLSDAEVQEACNQYNPGNLTKEQIEMYLYVPELSHYNTQDKKEAEQLKRILNRWKGLNPTVNEAIFF